MTVAVFHLILLIFLGVQIEAVEVSSDFLISGDSLGRIKLGQSKKEVFRLYQDHEVKEVDLLLEGLPAPALQIYKGKELVLTAGLDDNGTVHAISTLNRKFATAEGIRVGSTVADAKRWYGKPIFVGGGEGGFYVAFHLKPGKLSFRVDVQPDPLPKYLTDKSKILEVLVVR